MVILFFERFKRLFENFLPTHRIDHRHLYAGQFNIGRQNTARRFKLMQASFGMSALLYSFLTVYIFHAFPLIWGLTFNS